MRWPPKKNLIINRDVSAAIAKPLLAAGRSHNTNKNDSRTKSKTINR